MKYRPKHIAEYIALRGFQIFVNVMPYRIGLTIGAGFSWIAYYLIRWRVDEAKKRIRDVMGETLSNAEVTRIARLSLRHLFFNAVDILRSPRWTREQFDKNSNFDIAAEAMNKLVADGRGAVVAVPHMGSWELGGVAASTHDIPMFFMYSEQRNPLFNKLITQLRSGTGAEAIARENKTMVRQVIRKLKDGKVLAIVNDIRSRTEGLPIQFLGKEANIAAGMALFARQAKVPILPMVAYREGWTQHRCKVFDPVEPDLSLDKRDDWIRMTQLTLSMYEEEIRKRPEHYFWYNKRWVLDPFIPKPEKSSTADQA